MNFGLSLLAAYLIGAVPVSYLAARFLAGIDLRQQGSGNLGATNLYRVLGLKYAVPVALLDVLKGAGPVLALSSFAGANVWYAMGIGAAAIVGHVFPVYLKFKGGKGVATAAGVVLAVAPLALSVSVGVWLVLLLSTGIMSVASIMAAVAFPIAVRILEPANTPAFVAGVVISGFIVWTHRTNIRRLVNGTEPRVMRRAGRQKEA